MNTEPTNLTLSSQGLTLSVLEQGPPDGPTVIIVHGLRDCAQAFVPLAGAHLADRFRVLLLEHRGHGLSDHSDAYAMPHFLMDLHACVDQLTSAPVAVFGHSLGGHVVSRFAALFPELVRCLVIVEGLGPPERARSGDPEAEVAAYRVQLQRLTPPPPRPLPDLDFAAGRLQANNPRLAGAEARRLAKHLTTRRDGQLVWNFDSRAHSVFIGKSSAQDAAFYSQVRAPVCLISGALSHEYWGQQMRGDDFTGHFAEGEMEARAALFPHHEHHWFEHSGHMVHYDEPARLGTLTRQFLEQHHV